MKITKQAKGALFVMLAAISILPGCGKKSGSTTGGGGAATSAFSYSFGGVGGSSGCATITARADGSMIFPVSGQAQIGATGIAYAEARVGGAGFAGGNYYARTNASNDSIQLTLAGTMGGTGTISATVSLAPITVYALGGPGAFCVQGLLFQNAGLSPGSPGVVYGGVYLYTSSGSFMIF